MALRPKNWEKFQHYKQRRPPWIKFHRSLLDDYEFHCLPLASRALAPMLWLLASEADNGEIDGDTVALSFRLRMTEKDLLDALKPLIDKGMFENASAMLATRLQDACLETEAEAERETEKSPLNPPLGGKTVTKVERKAKGTRLPEDWCHDIKHEVLAREMGVVLYDELMKFRDYFLSEGKVKADWNRTFNTWLRNAGERRSRATTWSRK